MEKEEHKRPAVGKTILKFIFGLILFLLVLVGAALIAIRIPAVQTRAVQEASALLSDKIGHEVSVGRVNIKFFKSVILDKVKVLDYKNEVLFSVDQLDADISFFNIFNPNKLYISNLTLTQPKANLIKYRGTEKFNLNSLLDSLNNLLQKKTTTTTKTPFDFQINAISIINGHFTYDDQNKPFAASGLDYQHLILDNFNGLFSEINLGDTIRVQVTGLQTTESRSKTHLHRLSTQMAYAPTFLEFADLDLRLGKSNLAQYVRFDYRKFSNFSQFNDSVKVTAHLENTRLFSADIAQFAPQVKNINDSILISGDVTGRVRRFTAKNLDARYGQYTHVVGNLSANGLPAVREAFMDLNLKPSVLNATDLKKYIPARNYALGQRLGTVKFNGNFLGFYNDFVANGSFATALGNVVSDINLKINNNTNITSYNGYLKTDNFQLGKLLGNEQLVSTISLDGRVKGSGFNLNTANVNVDAKIAAVRVKGYNYRHITAKGTFRQQVFAGNIVIRDPNINLAAQGKVNLNPSNPAFDLIADVNELNFKALGLAKQNIFLKTRANLNFTGLKLDNILGQATFTNTTLTLNQKVINLDSVALLSKESNNYRTVQVNSDIADMYAIGNWDFTSLIRDMQVLVKEYRLNFESNEPAITSYYRNKIRRQPQEYNLEYILHLKKANPIVQAFVPQLRIADNSRFEGTFRQGENAIFALTGHADTIYYGQNIFYYNDLDFNTSKLPYSRDVLANASILSQKQALTTGGATENLFLEGVWSNRTILFNSNLAQSNTTNKANLSGHLAFLENRLQIVFDTSDIQVLDQVWSITPNNVIEISNFGKEINFHDFVISHQNQQVSLAGLISQNPNEELQVKLDNFRLENLNPLLKLKLEGILNASVNARDIFKVPIISSTFIADSVSMDTFLIGTLAGQTNWEDQQNRLGVDVGITRNNMKVLNLTGYYNPTEATNQLDLLAVMDEAPVKLVDPFLKTLFSDLGGTMQGRIKIAGQLKAPVLEGSVLVSDGRFNFTYLNTVYTFTDRIYFTENDITFRNIRLRDNLNNTGTISGSIIHQGFKDMILDLRGEFQKLMVMNTTRQNNELYYGTAIATGSATVLGPPSDLVINIDARSEAGTRMFIPLDNNAKVTRQSFIHFVNRNLPDTAATTPVAARNQVNLAGINMNFNLNITPDAYLEIILDQNTGDIVRGSGTGRVRMNIDTRGEFTMDGQVEIVRGAYNFTLYNIINKEFLIRRGGTITWNGDPYAGIMDLTATYTQTVPIPASLGVTGNVRVPVTAIMELDGQLLTPQINLGLEFNNTPSDIEAQIASYLADIRNDQDELNRQVFSLLILKRLSDRNTIGLASGGAGQAVQQGIYGSLSELVTNQLGNWLSQLDNNLEVDIGMQTLNSSDVDDIALRNLQVRLSYSLLEGRLRVSREGGLRNYSDPALPENLNNNTLAGDWRVEYYLGQNGKLRARMEYITSQRQIYTPSTTNTAISRGSILHTEQFDNLRELFGRRRLRRRYREQQKVTVPLDSDPRFDTMR